MSNRPPPPQRGDTRASSVRPGEWTAVDVEREILRLSKAMDDNLTVLEERAVRAAHAEADYKARYHKERLTARDQPGHGPGGRTTDDEANDCAIVAADTELRERLIAEALQRVTEDHLRTQRSQIDALRTIASNIRAATFATQ